MEQFGTPEEVYNRPASTFVASFIGSPPMNLLQNAPGCIAGRLMGIRPEHLDLTPGRGWSLHTETVELLGAERLVHARLGDELITLRLDASVLAPQPGERFHSTARANRVHWFNPETGKRFLAEGEAA
jgi:sn-glycerol 3-phosphate transport system ATP-binding protein